MLSWIIDSVPFWVWCVIIGVPAAILLAVYWPIVLGLWNALPRWAQFLLGGFVAVFLVYRKGRSTGRANALEEQRKRDFEAELRRRKTDEQIAKMTPAQKKKELDKWLRD